MLRRRRIRGVILCHAEALLDTQQVGGEGFLRAAIGLFVGGRYIQALGFDSDRWPHSSGRKPRKKQRY